jgi:hypothetical protein
VVAKVETLNRIRSFKARDAQFFVVGAVGPVATGLLQHR